MLRWVDCVKRDVRKGGEEEDWKKKTRDRGGWKRLSDEALKKLGVAPRPDKGKRGREISCHVPIPFQFSPLYSCQEIFVWSYVLYDGFPHLLVSDSVFEEMPSIFGSI